MSMAVRRNPYRAKGSVLPSVASDLKDLTAGADRGGGSSELDDVAGVSEPRSVVKRGGAVEQRPLGVAIGL
jgi:hypothetical protein